MNVLEVSKISKHFGGIQAVSNVSFSVAAGEVIACVGPNAAGKTTLLNLITGWHRPDEGKVYIMGQPIRSFTPEVFASRGVVRTFQRARLFHKQTVLENLLLASSLKTEETIRAALLFRKGWMRNQRKEAVLGEEMLKSLGTFQLRDRRAGDLSGGEQRLVGLTAAAMRRPKVLVLDEPVANLSQEARQKVALYLSEQREAGVACILVEHDLSFVRQVADRVLILSQGRIVEVHDATAQSTWELVERSYSAGSAALSDERPHNEHLKKSQRAYTLSSDSLFKLTACDDSNHSSNGTEAKTDLASSKAQRKRLLPLRLGRLRRRLDGNNNSDQGRRHRVIAYRSNISATYKTLSVRGLSVDYGRGSVVQDVSLDVCPGEVVSLTGNNGAGKSTLIRAILGLIPYKGTISLGELPLTSLPTHDISRLGLSYVPQHRKVFPSLTVLENLQIAFDRRSNARGGRLGSALQAFPELEHLLNVPAGSLSGGQQQMVAIERALAQQPRLLLLDEPSAGLSEHLWQRLADLFKRLVEGGLPILIVEHRPSAVKSILTKEYLIKGGRLFQV